MTLVIAERDIRNVRYDLTRLGSQEFEEMSQALAIAVLGNAVSVFGAGPDGGREATFDGAVRYPDPAPPDGTWNGYGVLQAKFRRTPTTTNADTKWFLAELRKELNTWLNQDSGRRKRGRIPNYLVITTNVVLSADPGRGGIDQTDDLLREAVAQGLPLRGWAIWHHDQICTYLAVHDGVRRTYGAFVAAGDVLAEVQDALRRLTATELPNEDFSELLTMLAAMQLRGQQWVRLNQAGHKLNLKLHLSDVGIDLPARVQPTLAAGQQVEHDVPGVIAHIVQCGDQIRRGRPASQELPHLAIVGGPGQGKTTIGQLLCQVYRVALLADRPPHTLGPEVPEIIDQYQHHLARLGIPVARCRRWPVRIALHEFADAVTEKPSTTLLEYITQQSWQAGPINRRMLREWLREWPWLLVLDGLDEVADPDIRVRTLDAIGDFLIEAGRLEADLLVVATTRPQGYSEEFSPRFYQHLALQPMASVSALSYAEHLAEVQFAHDPEMKATIVRRLTTAASDATTARLMRTPLQVTIMTVLLERQARVPQHRYGLFEAYYNTLYDREIGKNTSISRILDQQRRNIDRLHERVGLLLQIRSEHAGEAGAQLSKDELETLAFERLREEDYTPDHATELVAELVKAATDRLVMLVGHSNATIGFEVRSLQELMAARALFAAREQGVLEILKDLAPSAHWRNTWLFAASRAFAHHEQLRADIIVLLEELDADTALSRYLMPGAQLAVDMLDEDIAAAQPRFTKLLIRHALRLLATSPGKTITRLTKVVHDTATSNTDIVHLGMDAINTTIANRGKATVTALDALAAWAELPGDAAITARSRLTQLKNNTPAELAPIIKKLRQSFPRRRMWFAYREDAQTTESQPAARLVPATPPPLPDIVLQRILESGLDQDRIDALTDLYLRLPTSSKSRQRTAADPAPLEDLVRIITDFEADLWLAESAVRRALNTLIARSSIDSDRLTKLARPSADTEG